MDEGSLLTADEGSGTITQFDVEREVGTEEMIAQESQFRSLLDGHLQPVNGQGIFRPDIDESLPGPDGIPAECHGLDNAVGITLHDASIHESSWVALIGIAHHIFLIGLRACREAPFASCGEAAATTAAQPRLLYDIDDIVGAAIHQAVGQSHIAITGDIFKDVFRIDESAIAQGHALLLAIKVHVLGVADMAPALGVGIEQPLYPLAAHDMFVDDLLHILLPHLGVEGVVGNYFHDRALFAESEAAGADHVDLLGESMFGHLLTQPLIDALTARGMTACAATGENLHSGRSDADSTALSRSVVLTCLAQFESLLHLSAQGFQVFS